MSDENGTVESLFFYVLHNILALLLTLGCELKTYAEQVRMELNAALLAPLLGSSASLP